MILIKKKDEILNINIINNDNNNNNNKCIHIFFISRHWL